MKASLVLADRFKEVIFNGTWISGTNYKAQLSQVPYEVAIHKIDNFNTIAALTFHIHYYVSGVLNVLKGGTLDIRDKYSFDLPPINSQKDWEKLLNQFWNDAECFAIEVEKISDEKLGSDFVDKKYGNYQRNIDAIIEHAYYHLGQMVLIHKMIRSEINSNK